jgi:hypothetical protein
MSAPWSWKFPSRERAGESLMPSPTMATTWPWPSDPSTSAFLSGSVCERYSLIQVLPPLFLAAARVSGSMMIGAPGLERFAGRRASALNGSSTAMAWQARLRWHVGSNGLLRQFSDRGLGALTVIPLSSWMKCLFRPVSFTVMRRDAGRAYSSVAWPLRREGASPSPLFLPPRRPRGAESAPRRTRRTKG